MKKAYFCTAEELEQRGKDNLPKQFQSGEHLIYSSPATLAFNSPGAEGFGVKRAVLAVPGSIMLIVAPGCCGRNTSMISSMKEYNNRFFYLCMDETDIVTGRHLKKIPKAVASICESLEKKPSVVMICITCVDALLGTDMERVCKKAEEQVEKLEAEKDELEAQMADPEMYRDEKAWTATSRAYEECKRRLERWYERWETAQGKVEEIDRDLCG